MATSLTVLLVLVGCGVQENGLPEVAGSPAAAVEAPPRPEPTVTVTASVAPEPSVADASAAAAPATPDPPDDAEPAEEAAAAPLPAPENAADEQISHSFPGVGGTVLEAMDADGLAFEAKGSGENSFITAVGGREADDSAREYWALYVNGTYAQLGAGSQQASAEDTITWRLEKY
ncbi:DUF4430 domain-containing protein [Aquipuribacter sp. MA13-6]|uniref:DUF4430 domain-containing protein n=1 Tax=unclassified Aquipuribacter TaxID=2635084 RepID=UPI003EED455A